MKPKNFYYAVFRDFMKRYWYVFAIIAVALITAIGSFFYINFLLKKPAPPSFVTKKPAVQIQSDQLSDPPVLKTGIFCPLDGTSLETLPSHRMLAFAIDNSPEARPQSGLQAADLVVEMPVEGGITRLLAFYYHAEGVRIGPIRSARPYLISKAREYEAVFIHAGQSPQAAEYFIKTKAEHIDEIPSTEGFWREKTRNAPHNLYTSTKNILDQLKTKGLNGTKSVNGLKFANTEFISGQDSKKLTIFYRSGEIIYDYQMLDKNYLRFIGEKAHIDGDSNMPLRIKNIIVQFVSTNVLDGVGRLSVKLEDKGRCLISSGGKIIDGIWEKTKNDVTHYYDDKGVEIILPTGQTWIEIVPNNVEIDY